MRLAIYVATGCKFCDRATTIAREIGDRFPFVNVAVVDVAQASEGLPETVFAVPTYVLDGQVASLGNPAMEDLTLLIERKTAQSQA